MTIPQEPAAAPAAGRRPPIPWLPILGLWTVYGLLNTAQQHTLYLMNRGHNLPWTISLLLQMPLAYAWALATPGILWMGRTFPFRRDRWLRSGVVHLLASLALVFVLDVGYSWHAANVLPISMYRSLFSYGVRMFVSWALADGVLYWLVLAVAAAVESNRRSKEREVAAAQLETQLAQADLHSLKMQLQPHFLFNALNTIGSLVRTGDRDEAVRVVARLGDLLRGLLDGGNRQVVPLREELAFIRNYLEIEEARFRDRLRVTISVDDEVLDALVPHLILQPLVENAVKHGIAARRTAGHLVVTARRINDRLHLLVQDDGPGLGDAPRTGIGLSNTHARLSRLYGGDYELEMTNAPGGGFQSRIAVPLRGVPAPAAQAV